MSLLQWSDGISLSCADSLVENNHITDATDAGIVVFGSPGSTIRNNTIQATDVSVQGIDMSGVVKTENGKTDSSIFGSSEDHAWRHQQSVQLVICVHLVIANKEMDLVV